MARLVVQKPIEATGNLQSGQRQSDTFENYIDRVSRYFPAEILGAFVVFNNILSGTAGADSSTASVLVIYAALVVLNVGYMSMFAGKVRNKKTQIAISTFAFLVWSYGIGGAIWQRIQALVPQVPLRGTLLTTMVPVLASLLLALYSPDGLVRTAPARRVSRGAV